jgi:hypothetical protein
MIGLGTPYIVSRRRGLFRGVFDNLGITPTGPIFSVRRTRREYTGPLLRVRRSSDNSEQDFGYLPNGWLNTSSLLEFVGSGSGFVTVWYDQNGTNNATMSTPSRNPLIVNNGVLEMNNGRPAVRFIDNSISFFGHNLEFQRFHSLSTSFVAFASVYSVINDFHFPYIVGGFNNFGFIVIHPYLSGAYSLITNRSVYTVIHSNFTFPNNVLVSRFSLANRVNLHDFVNKTQVINTNDNNSDFKSFSIYHIGNAHIGAEQDIRISELLCFADISFTAAQIDTLQNNQIASFNITP